VKLHRIMKSINPSVFICVYLRSIILEILF